MIDINKLKDFKFFAENFFKIRTKSGEVKPFCLNRAQLYLHERLESQLRETGKVRAICTKGRQQGCSTYIQARYFHKTITNIGIKTFILTHESAATKNLFEMTKRYYENLPPGLCPLAEKNNVKELRFESIDSGYSLGTAGARGTGRSQTIQLLHGSETAYWPNAAEHAQGLMQAVGDQAGTEIILESTANGIGNYFHSVWVAAEQGKSDFQAIFIPWFWQPEYTIYYHQKPSEINLSEEEQFLLDTYSHQGMTREHIYWRRIKIGQFSSDHDLGVKLFNTEYPCCANDAFLNPIDNTFINSKYVSEARKAQVDIQFGSPLIIGVDPAIGDNDRCAIIKRKSRVAYDLEILRNHNTMELSGKLKRMIDELKPAKVFIDCIGIGAGVVDRLREMGYECVEGINVARTANNKEQFGNLRAELWSEMRDWFMGEIPVKIPDSDELQTDLCGLGFKHRSNGQLLIESKDELKKRGMPSPDCFVAGTLIRTPQGLRDIKDLQEGEDVITPFGITKIIKKHCTQTELLTTVKFSNGKVLSGKGKHKIFVWKSGEKRMDALACTFDRVESYSRWKLLYWKIVKSLFMMEENTEFKPLVDIIKRSTGISRKGYCIAGFGSIITGLLKKAMRSITRMATGVIMIFPIWKNWKEVPIEGLICLKDLKIQNIEIKTERTWIRPFKKPQSGMPLLKGSNGIRNMESLHGKIAKSIKKVASFVLSNLKLISPLEKRQDSAQAIVAKPVCTQNKRQSQPYAFGVIKNFIRTNIEKLHVVPKSVQTENVFMTNVYNLTLEKHNAYYANDILVFNCADALMLTFSYGQYAGNSAYQSNFIPIQHQRMFI